MKIFVTGASGYLGSSLAKRLAGRGHTVRGLVRNPDKMSTVQRLGVDPVAGDLSHGQMLAEQARWADAVVNAADSDHLASIEVMLEVLAGTGKAFLHTSGSGLVSDTANGEPSAVVHTEVSAVEPIPERRHRLAVDNFVRAAALRHVRSVVICNTLIYGHGLGVGRDSVQVPLLVAQAMDSGIVRHVGRGLNRWSNIHIADVVTLYLVALERAPAGSFVYAEAGAGSRPITAWGAYCTSKAGMAMLIRVEYVPGTSVEFLAKLAAAKGQPAPFDIVDIADETVADFVDNGLVTKIDLANVPNIANIDPALYDENKIAYWAAQPAIVYNVDKFAEAGVPAPQRYSDLADPRLKGKVLVGDIAVYISYYEITALTRENGGSETNAEPGFAKLKEIAPHSATTSLATLSQLFQSGDVWAAIWSAHVGVRLQDSGLNVAAVHPAIEDKRPALARGYVGIVEGTPAKEAAEYYINALLSKYVQMNLNTKERLVPVNNEALLEVSREPVLDAAGNPFLLLTPEDIANSWQPDYSLIDKRDWGRQLQRALVQ